MAERLIQVYQVNRRYSRSVSLDRDLESSEALSGYVLTPKNCDLAMRILDAVRTPDSPRAWTITGLFGTGKSAFAQFLCALCAPTSDRSNAVAREIANSIEGFDSSVYRAFRQSVGRNGMVRAVCTARREPIANTILRALKRGVDLYWSNTRGARPKAVKAVSSSFETILRGEDVSPSSVLEMAEGVSEASGGGLLLVIDELGKNLEYCAGDYNSDDLYLLQQLAELPSSVSSKPICLLGVLHQSFSDYGGKLAALQRNEWAKVQGRFEDVPFTEATDQTIRLISEVISYSGSAKLAAGIAGQIKEWEKSIDSLHDVPQYLQDNVSALFPLHPLTAWILPLLCERFGQNDRSVFSFLTSEEPHAFMRFLRGESFDGKCLPLLKLDIVYDYFMDSAGLQTTKQHLFQRWAEIQHSVADASHLGADHQRLLKVIGVLNIASTGAGRASRRMVISSLCDDPSDRAEIRRWKGRLKELMDKGLLTYRKQLDEYRIWQGSDFDVEQALAQSMARTQTSLGGLLTKLIPPRPLIAHRHSYESGSLRRFTTIFVDEDSTKEAIGKCDAFTESDGLLCFWVGSSDCYTELPSRTKDGRPVIVLVAREAESLRSAAGEFTALMHIDQKTPELQVDGVARKEVRQRLKIARQILDRSFDRAFRQGRELRAIVDGQEQSCSGEAALSNLLSDVCDSTYECGPRLWNELINKDALTSQAAKARRELLEAMVTMEGKPTLGIEGYGPERSMFESLLASTGIYKCRQREWSFGNPLKGSGVHSLWKGIEESFLQATSHPIAISEVHRKATRPPFGAKTEILPVIITAILLKHSDDMSLYMDGSFLPVLGAQHLELMVKRPERFGVKHFRLRGLRMKLFAELESTVKKATETKARSVRNTTVLRLVRPMVKFVNSLPKYTQQTNSLGDIARNVRERLISSREPDALLFDELPRACGLAPISERASMGDELVREFRKRLVSALRELNSCYDKLLDSMIAKIHGAFAVEAELPRLREHLRVRASYLLGTCIEPRLRSFIKIAADESPSDRAWIESVLMIISDKPVSSWTDEDETRFEVNVTEMSRRFINFEAIRKEFAGGDREGFSARRVVLTRPSGEESSRVFWVERDSKRAIDSIVDNIIDQHGLKDDTYLLQGVLSSLLDRSLFGSRREESASSESDRTEKKSGKAS